MRTPASLAGHPIHPMLVPIAIGCWLFSFAADLLRLGSGALEPWAPLAYHTMLGGIAGALCAAMFGLIDLLALPAGRARTTGLAHMALNFTVLAIFVVDAWMRRGASADLALPTALSAAAIALLLAAGWLGGRLVYELGVGVDADAR